MTGHRLEHRARLELPPRKNPAEFGKSLVKLKLTTGGHDGDAVPTDTLLIPGDGESGSSSLQGNVLDPSIAAIDPLLRLQDPHDQPDPPSANVHQSSSGDVASFDTQPLTQERPPINELDTRWEAYSDSYETEQVVGESIVANCTLWGAVGAEHSEQDAGDPDEESEVVLPDLLPLTSSDSFLDTFAARWIEPSAALLPESPALAEATEPSDRKRPASSSFNWRNDDDDDGASDPHELLTVSQTSSSPLPDLIIGTSWRSETASASCTLSEPPPSSSQPSESSGSSERRTGSASSSTESSSAASSGRDGPNKRFRPSFAPVFEQLTLPPPPPKVFGIGSSFKRKDSRHQPLDFERHVVLPTPTINWDRPYWPAYSQSLYESSQFSRTTMTTVTMSTTPRPPLEEQLRVLRAAINADLHPDARWYILPARWFMLLEHLADPATRPRPPNGGPSSLDDLATELEALIDHDAYNANNSSTPLPEGSADFRGTVPAPGSEGGWQIRRGLTQMQQQQAGGPGDDVDMDGDAPDADIVLIEQFGWQQVVAWYGPVRPPSGLPRSVISKDDGILQIELNPPTFVLFQARPSDSTQVANGAVQSAPLRLSLSADALVTELHGAARSALGVTAGSSRLWHIRKSLRELADAQSQAQAQASTNSSLQRSIPTHLLTVLEANHLDTYSDAARSQGLLRDAEIESGDSFALELPSTTSSGEAVWALQINERGLAMEVAAPDVDMATSAPKPLFSQPAMFPGSPSAPAQNGGIVTRSKATTTEGKGKTPGLRGLTNLGNTCFMNSGLQCLSNTPELSQYFQSGAYTSEVNRANPLGMNGQVAEQFGALVEQIWDPNGSSSNSYFASNAVTPRQFKSMIGRYNSSFAGYGQQDTQELIAFLLDGLHEDLNRIHKKPYIEKPDWKDGGKEAELALFAQECWEGYKKRNDSAIVDLFQGQLKSTLVCPDCHRVSLRDRFARKLAVLILSFLSEIDHLGSRASTACSERPVADIVSQFMYLTLPIPVKKYDSRVFYIVPLDPRKQRMQVNASYTTNSTLAQVKRKLANLVDIPAANVSLARRRPSCISRSLLQLLATDQYKNNVWAYFSDDAAIGQCGAQDVVVLHELPFAVTQSNDKAAPAVKDDTRDVIAVPVYSLAQERNYNADPRTFLEPFYIELTRSQAKDEVAIKRKVAERYAELVDVERQDDFWQRFEEAPQQQEAEEASESRPASPAPTTPSPFDLTFAAADTSDREKNSHSFSFGKSSFFKGTSLRRLSAAETRAQRKGLFNRAEKMVKSFGSGSRSSSNDEEALVDWKDAIFPVWDMATAQEFFGRDLEGRYRARDNMWVQVTDPAILERAKSARDPRRITLADCLDDFEREETLGENDLWYCSQVGVGRA